MFINLFSKKEENVVVDIVEMEVFYKMLLKMKKKRPNMDVYRLMKLIYKKDFEDNLELFQ